MSPYSEGDGYGFADRDRVSLHLSLDTGHEHETGGDDGGHGHEHVGTAYLYVADADFDLRFLIRAVCRTKAYARTSARTHPSQDDPRSFVVHTIVILGELSRRLEPFDPGREGRSDLAHHGLLSFHDMVCPAPARGRPPGTTSGTVRRASPTRSV